jgi:hypothetical protein
LGRVGVEWSPLVTSLAIDTPWPTHCKKNVQNWKPSSWKFSSCFLDAQFVEVLFLSNLLTSFWLTFLPEDASLRVQIQHTGSILNIHGFRSC